MASSPRVELTRHLLHGYDKTVHPAGNVQLQYGLLYLDCPIPDPGTGALVSRLHETQVRGLVSHLETSSSPLSSASFYISIGRIAVVS